jgi:MtN3 and saliva related transmembrane protein
VRSKVEAITTTMVSVFGSFTALDLIGYTGGVCTALASIPQIVRAYKTQSMRDISYWWQITNIVGLTLSYIYFIVQNVPAAWMPLSVELFCALILFVMKLRIDGVGVSVCGACCHWKRRSSTSCGTVTAAAAAATALPNGDNDVDNDAKLKPLEHTTTATTSCDDDEEWATAAGESSTSSSSSDDDSDDSETASFAEDDDITTSQHYRRSLPQQPVSLLSRQNDDAQALRRHQRRRHRHAIIKASVVPSNALSIAFGEVFLNEIERFARMHDMSMTRCHVEAFYTTSSCREPSENDEKREITGFTVSAVLAQSYLSIYGDMETGMLSVDLKSCDRQGGQQQRSNDECGSTRNTKRSLEVLDVLNCLKVHLPQETMFAVHHIP